MATGITKAFGTFWALRGVNLTLHRGEFLTIFGPNGAGKTTLLRILATLSKPTGGTVWVAGHDAASAGEEIRQRLGVISHQTFLYDDLTATENLIFYGRMYNVPHLPERIQGLLDQVGLSGRAHDPVRTFSRGMQQRLTIARALLHDPDVLLLDEPDTGLDQQAAAMLRDLILSGRSGGRSAIITTHNLARGLELADRIALLVKGKIVYQGNRADLSPGQFEALYQQAVT